MKLIFLLSLRSLKSHLVKNLIVGALLSFGSLLWVVGTTLTQNIENEMQRSISESLTGDLQVYDQNARDPLSFFGGFSVGAPDIGQIENFEHIRDALLALPEIKSVVPMGILIGSVTVQGELEDALGELRQWIWQRIEDGNLPDSINEYPVTRVRRALTVLLEDLNRASRIIRQDETSQLTISKLRNFIREEWWRTFPKSPLERLETLDTEIAPSAPAGQMVYLRVLGTDMALFQESFQRMMILRGRALGEGERGMMLNQQFMDEHMKVRALRTMDQLHQAVTKQGKIISKSAELKNRAVQLERQSQSLVHIIPAANEKKVDALLSRVVGTEGSLRDKVRRFFRVNDKNIRFRHSYFYEHLSAQMKIYAFDVGDLVPLTSFSKSGYPRSVNVRVRGVFTFRGLEKSELAGATNLLDIHTFRYLYGQPSDETVEEVEQIRSAADIRIIPRESLESSLFSAELTGADKDRDATGNKMPSLPILPAGHDPDATYDPLESKRGLALHAAVLVREDASLPDVEAKIEALSDTQNLEIQVVDWRKASGLVGQFVLVVRFVVFIALCIILAVAVVIMNNTLVIATLDRVQEIGTLRALGAQKHFVLATTLCESFLLATLAAVASAFLSLVFLLWLQRYGIPAQSDVWIFLFGGPRLHPEIFVTPFVSATGLLLILSQAATLYPALLATRVSPIVAMQDVQS